MTMRAFLNAARWLGIATAAHSKPRHPITRRRLSVEPLEERRVLSTSSFASALYQDVLGRAGDSSGLDYYTNLLATSTPPVPSSPTSGKLPSTAELRSTTITRLS
jgi:hypothetical protein